MLQVLASRQGQRFVFWFGVATALAAFISGTNLLIIPFFLLVGIACFAAWHDQAASRRDNPADQ